MSQHNDIQCTQESPQRGFSLVELMVAVALVVITVPVFVGLQLNAVKLNNRAAELDQSIWGAQAKMEELWLEDVKDVKKGSDTMTLPDGRTLSRSWDVKNNKPAKGMKTVTVEVVSDWIDEAEAASLTFIMSDRVKSNGGGGGPPNDDDCTYTTASGKTKKCKSGATYEDPVCETYATKSGKTKTECCVTYTTKSGKTKTDCKTKKDSGKTKDDSSKEKSDKEKSGKGKDDGSKEKSGKSKDDKSKDDKSGCPPGWEDKSGKSGSGKSGSGKGYSDCAPGQSGSGKSGSGKGGD